ncbi:hypothetical protein M409DRAFT_64381 [Zasmidium cellare ATCC 36951]|uniref:Cytochrome P450 monooxygenase n=1 Tax=Zasmidium cellare ATCC 36951 TaxID=1080233 RepID=A0A6A6CW14_ZASCE|nr:uncharacterized protein M409DRAFT_64381 [Zasmidium cellare ATCC 36951]KAF2169989.1 hypothetical protein M409DRAFT_64381 [Zasmidium cellare ATCC 36951]
MESSNLQQLVNVSPTGPLILLLAVAPLVYISYTVIYSLYFSPLSKFPGPKLWACSELFYQRAIVKGTAHQEFLEFFSQYGPVVRITPKELIFSSPQAVRDIYGTLHVQKQLGEDHMISTLDHNVHARQRRMLSSAFSERSVRELEPVLTELIDKLIAGLQKEGVVEGKDIDIKQWVNYTTFDITGYLVFGESFHCLDNAAMHPWVAFMTDSIKAQVFMGIFLRLPGMKPLMPYLTPKKVATALSEHQSLSYNRLEQRLEQGQKTEKSDLIGLLLKNGITQKSGGFSSGEDHISKGELHANSTILILGGSETSATLLSGAIFFLTTHPSHLTRLTNLIRTTFASHTSITSLSLTPNKLPYLHAILQETLRMYPPGANQFTRRTPPDGAVIDGHFVPRDTYVGIPQWASYRNEANFKRAGEWIPERWMGGEEWEGDQRDVLQPFSLGPYSCIGVNLAWAEIRLILCRLLWHFDFEVFGGQERWYEDQKVFLVWEKPELRVRPPDSTFSSYPPPPSPSAP